MSETFINIMVFYLVQLVLSLIFIIIGIIGYIARDGQEDYINGKFGIKCFFSSVKDSGKRNVIWLFLAVPLLNVLMSFLAMLALCTDLGDEL